MRNALRKLLVIGAISLCGVGPERAYAYDAIPECIGSGDHAAVTYFLLDRTDELKDTQNLQQTLLVLKKMIAPGERLIVGVSAGQASETRVIMDVGRPVESIWVSKLKLRAAEKHFDDCFKLMQDKVVQQGEVHKTSALLETLGVVSKVLATDAAAKKRVVVFSDMIQNSQQVSFYNAPKIDAPALLKVVEKDQLVVPFKDVDAHTAGEGKGTSDEKARSIEEFWKSYFSKSGAVLKFYGPVLFTS